MIRQRNIRQRNVAKKCANPYASDIESAPNQTTELLNEFFHQQRWKHS